MVQWRFQALPAQKVANTIFSELKPDNTRLIDFSQLESLFLIEEKPEKADGAGADGAAAGGGGGGGGGGKKGQERPKVMSQQRATVIEIISGRLKKPMSEIKLWIQNADKKNLTLDLLSELKSLFPVKPEAYEEEKAALLGFPDHKLLTKNEHILYELLTIPRIREKLAVLSFDQEATQKIVEVKQDLKVVAMALRELRSEKIRKLMELALAAGNYLNSGGKNGRAPATGFKIDSLLKMADVVSPKDKTNLLQFIVKQLYDKEPGLCNFYEEVPSLEAAASAIASVQTEIGAVKKGFNELKGELTKCNNEKDFKWMEALGKTEVTLQVELDGLEQRMKEINEAVAYFGETDISAFFLNWVKFVQLFQKMVKNWETIRKREEANRKKEEEKAKKAQEKNLIENFVSGVKMNGSLRGMKPEQKQLISQLNKQAQQKDDDKLLDQISVSLKSGQTFSRLRGHRAVNDLKEQAGEKPTNKLGTLKGKPGEVKKKTLGRSAAPNNAGGGAHKQLSGKTIRECSIIVDDILSLVVAPPPAHSAPSSSAVSSSASSAAPNSSAPSSTLAKDKPKASVMSIQWAN